MSEIDEEKTTPVVPDPEALEAAEASVSAVGEVVADIDTEEAVAAPEAAIVVPDDYEITRIESPAADNDADEDTTPTSSLGTTYSESHDFPRGKMHCFNWLADIPGGYADSDMVEVQFKNTRKGFYRNSTNIPLKIGDMVAVEASPGHDIGQVTLIGALVNLQMRKANIKPNAEIKRIFRKAKPADMEKYREACARETETMIRARKIAEGLKLNMKIGDVEFQGDGNKAIFYYIADERVDFRQLIKDLAAAFKVRIEMKQIGARQEAGRIGGIGPCGRPLCCSSWMSSFVSVATSAARYQDISLNPQKLAGQCAKLKCCLNFEVDTYVESLKKMPGRDVRLETADATYFHFKTDIFRHEITYSTDKNIAANLVTISAARAFEIIAMNKEGQKPLSLIDEATVKPKEKAAFGDILGEDDLTRFDRKKKNKRRGGNKPGAPKGDGSKGQPAENAGNRKPEKPKDKKPGNNGQQKPANANNSGNGGNNGGNNNSNGNSNGGNRHNNRRRDRRSPKGDGQQPKQDQ